MNPLSFPNSPSPLPPFARELEPKFIRGCLPPGKCYAAVITYILAELYGKSRTRRPLAAFNHHYTLTRAFCASLALLVPLKSLLVQDQGENMYERESQDETQDPAGYS